MYCGKLLRTAGSFPSQQLERARSVKSGDTGYMVIAIGAAAGFFSGDSSQKNTAIYLVKYGCATLLHARSFGRVRPRRKNRWNSRVGIECSVILRTPNLLASHPETQ